MQARSAEAARRTRVPVFYYLFDLPYVEGADLTRLELRHRKALLRHAISFGGRLRFSTHRVGSGEAYHREACRRGWEGLIAKRSDSEYVQRRSNDWLKMKCVTEQEFLIGGYTEPQGRRSGFGALLIGYYEDGELRYAGKVGTGYSEETLGKLGARLASLERAESPFALDRVPTKEVHWVSPKLVAEIAFTEWTRDGRLRHPRFVGLRRDKRPAEVVREGR
jgi:DNA ligase D-like protein (predicted ligase)